MTPRRLLFAIVAVWLAWRCLDVDRQKHRPPEDLTFPEPVVR